MARNFNNPKETNFLYFRFNILWKDALLAAVKGMVQVLVTTRLYWSWLVGDEGVLGLILRYQWGADSNFGLYIRTHSSSRDRLKIFVGGLILFFIAPCGMAFFFGCRSYYFCSL